MSDGDGLLRPIDRRGFAWSLVRGLLIVGVLGGLFAWMALWRGSREDQAREAIARLLGEPPSVEYSPRVVDDLALAGPVTVVTVPPGRALDEGEFARLAAQLRQLPAVMLHLERSAPSRRSLLALRGATGLRGLSLRDARVAEEDLLVLRNLRRLEVLDLRGTEAGDWHLRELATFLPATTILPPPSDDDPSGRNPGPP